MADLEKQKKDLLDRLIDNVHAHTGVDFRWNKENPEIDASDVLFITNLEACHKEMSETMKAWLKEILQPKKGDGDDRHLAACSEHKEFDDNCPYCARNLEILLDYQNLMRKKTGSSRGGLRE